MKSLRSRPAFGLLLAFVVSSGPTLSVGAQSANTPATQRPPAVQSDSLTQQQRPQAPTPYYDYPLGSRTDTRRTLTAAEAIQLALSNAAAFQQALFDERIASEDVKQARTALWPTFSVPITYWGTTPSTVRAAGDPLIASFVSASAINESIGQFNAAGTIDIAGRLRASVSRSKALLEAAHQGSLSAKRSLALATADAYYSLATTRERRRIADETLSLAEASVKTIETMRAKGEGEEADLYRARSAARLRRDDLEQSRLAESIAMNQLRVLTGLSYSTYIAIPRLTDSIPSLLPLEEMTENPQFGNRPELLQIDAQLKASNYERKAAKRELLPQLTYNIGAGADAANFHPLGRYSGGSAIISLNIPIYNFGASKSRAAQAQMRSSQLEIARVNTERQLQQEYFSARAGAMSALLRVQYTRDSAVDAQKNLNLILDRYRSGKATILDLIDAQSNYVSSRLAFYQSIADYQTSRLRIAADPVLVASQATSTEPAAIAGSTSGCGLDQSPSIGGLRLGMTRAQVAALLPAHKSGTSSGPAAAVEVIKGAEIGSQASAGSVFEGVNEITLNFRNDRVTFIRVAYPTTNKWQSKDEFLAFIASKLGVNGSWKPFYDWQNKDVRESADLRDLALECSGFRLSVGIGIEGIGTDQTPHYELEDMSGK